MMKKTLILTLLAVCWTVRTAAHTDVNEQPRLVVGIVVDQMRWDYLSRY